MKIHQSINSSNCRENADICLDLGGSSGLLGGTRWCWEVLKDIIWRRDRQNNRRGIGRVLVDQQNLDGTRRTLQTDLVFPLSILDLDKHTNIWHVTKQIWDGLDINNTIWTQLTASGTGTSSCVPMGARIARSVSPVEEGRAVYKWWKLFVFETVKLRDMKRKDLIEHMKRLPLKAPQRSSCFT